MTVLVRNLPKQYLVDCDDLRTYDLPIVFQGPGWYSLSDDKVYRLGRFATCSRIFIRLADTPRKRSLTEALK